MLPLIVAQINERKPPAPTGCLEQTAAGGRGGGGRRGGAPRRRVRSTQSDLQQQQQQQPSHSLAKPRPKMLTVQSYVRDLDCAGNYDIFIFRFYVSIAS